MGQEEHIECIVLEISAGTSRTSVPDSFVFPENTWSIQCSTFRMGTMRPQIREIGITLKNPLHSDTNAAPKNVTRLDCQGAMICSDCKIEKCFERIRRYNCIVRDGNAVISKQRCKMLNLRFTEGSFYLSGMVGLNHVYLSVRQSMLHLCNSTPEYAGSLELKYAQVAGEIAVDRGIAGIIFESVESQHIITLEITDEHKLVHIRELSFGLYDFGGCLTLH